uniref:PSI domain-containing protein n=1 Tax=Alexandrium monilatum TaxID=311494 RepID=A0A7S4QCL3_9DINO
MAQGSRPGPSSDMPAMLPRVATAAVLLRLATADVISPHPHVQTPGVQTCDELGGSCRVPLEDARSDADACEAGEELKEFDVRCDSGCGYWQGRCGQPCCVPAAKQNETTTPAVLEGKSAVGMASMGGAKGAGPSSLAWVDGVALTVVAGIALGLYRCTCPRERRNVGLLEGEGGVPAE